MWLLIGDSGFIGTNFAKFLTDNDYDFKIYLWWLEQWEEPTTQDDEFVLVLVFYIRSAYKIECDFNLKDERHGTFLYVN